MDIKPGLRLRSVVCTTEVVVVRGSGATELTCGGAPMAEPDTQTGGGVPAVGRDSGSVLGKRYEDPETGVEVLCVKAGAGSLAVGDRLLHIKSAKALPASD